MELVDQLTPIMGPDERQASRELSRRRLRPPVKVPGYEQEEFVGRGAFGEVWSAVDSNSGRRVAIKFYSHRGSVLDRQGILRAISPPKPSLVGRYFGYRDYFHGQGRDNQKQQEATPITGPHRSDVFLSQPENVLSVAFSVPIRDAETPSREPLGVLVMEADLGHFAEFTGARHQFAAIVDLRPDETGKEGLIAEHPQLHEGQAGSVRRYVSAEVLVELQSLREEHLRQTAGGEIDVGDDRVDGGEPGKLAFYRDPFDAQSDEPWLCSAQPTFVPRGGGRREDTGWTILVEERRRGVVAPLLQLWRSVLFAGLAAIALVVLLLTALWIYVLCHLSEERGGRRFLKRLVGMAESLRSTAGSKTLSSGVTARPAEAEVRQSHG